MEKNNNCIECGTCKDDIVSIMPPQLSDTLDCPTPSKCSTYNYTDCVVFNDNLNILCGQDVLATKGDNLTEILRSFAETFCAAGALPTMATAFVCRGVTVFPAGTSIVAAINALTAFFCTNTAEQTMTTALECGPDVIYPAGSTIRQAIIAVSDYYCANAIQDIYLEKTYAQLQTLSTSQALVPNILYKITGRPSQLSGNNPESLDNGIFLHAISTTQLELQGTRKMLCPKYYDIATHDGNSWIGQWNLGLLPTIGSYTIYGGMVFRSVTGVVGTIVDERNLDAVNWLKILKSDLNFYVELTVDCQYDFANDWINWQKDVNLNEVGISFIENNENYVYGFNPCDLTDWNIVGFYIYFGDKTKININNSNCNSIRNNSNCSISSNNLNFGIESNSNCDIISTNSNGRAVTNLNCSIANNSNCSIVSNLNFGIDNNSNCDVISSNSNGRIDNNSNCVLIQGNLDVNIQNISNVNRIEGYNGKTISFGLSFPNLTTITPILDNCLINTGTIITKMTVLGDGLDGASLQIGITEAGAENLITATTAQINNGVTYIPTTFHPKTTANNRQFRFEAIGANITTGSIKLVVEYI